MAKDMLKQPMSDILPVSCCSIIAWSCATLQTFRESLFTTLVEVMSGRCEMCQTFEVTNLLWACAQFQKHRHKRSFWIKVQHLLMTLLPVHFTFPQLLGIEFVLFVFVNEYYIKIAKIWITSMLHATTCLPVYNP